MIGRTFLLAALLSAGTFAYGQCGGSAPSEARVALTEVHGAALQEIREAQPVIDKWLPMVLKNLESGSTDKRWFRVAMAVERELVRYDRTDEARHVLELVARSHPRVAGRWPVVARKMLDESSESGQ